MDDDIHDPASPERTDSELQKFSFSVFQSVTMLTSFNELQNNTRLGQLRDRASVPAAVVGDKLEEKELSNFQGQRPDIQVVSTISNVLTRL